MEARLADNRGFCFGVRRAIDLAEKTLRTGVPVYCLGPLIHNPQAVAQLIERGFMVVDAPEEVPSNATVIIRSHGVRPEVIKQLGARGIKIVDATCPLVKRVQDHARVLARENYRVVVVGESHHPEVDAIVGIVGPEAVVTDDELPADVLCAPKVGVISQTTQDGATLGRVVEQLVKVLPAELRVFNTICSATLERQRAALELAGKVDVMFVLGGRNSANTARLAEMCAGTGVPTYHLETAGELADDMVSGRRVAGVTAGASTPDWVIEEFVKRIESIPG